MKSAATPSRRLAYADPPYPGMAHIYPEKEEVDHRALIERLNSYDGWALSTDERSLPYVLALVPSGTRVCAWVKRDCLPFRPNPFAAWEPVLVRPARIEPVLVGSAFSCPTATDGKRAGDLVGRKPREFCEWVFRCMGATQDDTLDDLFPGSGIVGRAWESYISQTSLRLTTRRSQRDKPGRNMLGRYAQPLPGMERTRHDRERPRPDRDAAKGGAHD